jgi:hypothetical protein
VRVTVSAAGFDAGHWAATRRGAARRTEELRSVGSPGAGGFAGREPDQPIERDHEVARVGAGGFSFEPSEPADAPPAPVRPMPQRRVVGGYESLDDDLDVPDFLK